MAVAISIVAVEVSIVTVATSIVTIEVATAMKVIAIVAVATVIAAIETSIVTIEVSIAAISIRLAEGRISFAAIPMRPAAKPVCPAGAHPTTDCLPFAARPARFGKTAFVFTPGVTLTQEHCFQALSPSPLSSPSNGTAVAKTCGGMNAAGHGFPGPTRQRIREAKPNRARALPPSPPRPSAPSTRRHER